MNSFATLSFIYAIFTIASSSILLYSFRKKLDDSAVYFLVSELFMAITCGVIFFINKKIIFTTPIWTAIPNFSALAAEIAIFFSIASLTRKIESKWFFLALTAPVLVAILIELMRDQFSIQILVWLFALPLTCLFMTNFWVCKFKLPTALSSNEFMKLFTWLELGMVVYGFIRILANFSPRAVLPRDDPSDLGVFIFSIYIVLGVFRYLSYLGIRITWINPSDPTPNTLNKPLAQANKEKDQLLQGLIASNRVIGISALASSLAHQLSQPLTTIALRADTTRRDLVQSGQDPKIIASIDEIATQSLRLTALVKNLRQFFDSNSSDHVPTNLQNKIDEILEIVEPQLQSNKIILLKEYKSNPIVFGDGIQIQQALINVINNSIDALVLSQESPKKISISLTSNQSQATITVRDNGGGIDSELLPTIFDLYKSTKKDGLGVGLWLSKTILANHQGGIEVKNDPIGWAAFTITLPIDQDSGANE